MSDRKGRREIRKKKKEAFTIQKKHENVENQITVFRL